MSVAAAHNGEGGLMAARNGVELPVAYATLALTLAATASASTSSAPRSPAGSPPSPRSPAASPPAQLIAKMVTGKPAPADPATEPSAAA